MKVERVLPGEYRVELYNRDGYIWVVREGRGRGKWYWYPGGYAGYDHIAAWETGGYAGPFTSLRKALADVRKRLLA